MIAFFTSVGFGASVSLLRVGGPHHQPEPPARAVLGRQDRDRQRPSGGPDLIAQRKRREAQVYSVRLANRQAGLTWTLDTRYEPPRLLVCDRNHEPKGRLLHYDLEGNFTSLNGAGEAVTGYTEAEALQRAAKLDDEAQAQLQAAQPQPQPA